MTLMAILFTIGIFARFESQSVEAESQIDCGNQDEAVNLFCVEIEKNILRSTVQIEIESWLVKPDESGYEIKYSVGHGTVVGGRFLITHNHYSLPLAIQSEAEDPTSYALVNLYNTSGEQVFRGPMTEFELIGAASETLIIAHPGEKFFEKLGFVSAETWKAGPLPLAAGMRVAQIDWDGKETVVKWTTVQAIVIDTGTPRVIVADRLTPGASGGGIFFNTIHVANNWRVEEWLDASGQVMGGVTTGALNVEVIQH